MGTAIQKALELIISGDPELLNILATTARMSLMSSLISLLIGVPIGIGLGTGRFPGRTALIVLIRTWMGMPPVVGGLLFYLLFSGVGPFRHFKLLFTVSLMIVAQVFLITPIVAGNMETYVSGMARPVLETAKGLGFPRMKRFGILMNECVYSIFTVYLLAYARAIAEVGAVSMVGGGIAWKTNVMTTAIMQYTNRGNFSLGIALGIILMSVSLVINIVISILQRRFSK